MVAGNKSSVSNIYTLRKQLVDLRGMDQGDSAVTAAIADITAALGEISGSVNVKDFGAAGDGVTDDLVAIQAAITNVELLGGGGVYFPAGNYRITAHLRVKKGIRLRGASEGSESATASQPGPPATYITYDGVSGADDIILVQAGTASDYVWYFSIENIALLGNNKANRALWLRSCRHAQVKAWTERCIIAGGVVDDGNSVISAFCNFQYFSYQAGSNAACLASHGLWLRSTVNDGTVGPTNTIAETLTLNPGATSGRGLVIGDHDSGWFAKVYGSVWFTAGGNDSQVRPARKNTIGFLNGICYVQGGATAAYGPRNVILAMQSESNSVQLDTALGTFATNHYTVIDRTAGDLFETRRYLMSDERWIPLGGGFAETGTPTIGSSGAALHPAAVNMAGAAESAWGMTIPPIKQWTAGTITGVRVWHTHSTASVGKQVLLTASIANKSDGGALGAGATTKQAAVAVPDTANNLTKTDVMFAAPVAYALDQLMILNLHRNGTDGATLGGDTLTTQWSIVGIELLYLCTGPDSDATPRWDTALDQLI